MCKIGDAPAGFAGCILKSNADFQPHLNHYRLIILQILPAP